MADVVLILSDFKIDFTVYCRNGYGSLLIHNNASSISMFLFSMFLLL